MSLNLKAKLAVRQAVKNNLISHEDEAIAIVKRYLPDIEGYKITGIISKELPQIVSKVFNKYSYKHPWFKNKVTRVIYQDKWGRIWNKTTGIVRKGIKIYSHSKTTAKQYGLDQHHIDDLGGMMWGSNDKKHFTCEYRTNLEEFNKTGPKPETFIG